jgi:hypothetical protein
MLHPGAAPHLRPVFPGAGAIVTSKQDATGRAKQRHGAPGLLNEKHA